MPLPIFAQYFMSGRHIKLGQLSHHFEYHVDIGSDIIISRRRAQQIPVKFSLFTFSLEDYARSMPQISMTKIQTAFDIRERLALSEYYDSSSRVALICNPEIITYVYSGEERSHIS